MAQYHVTLNSQGYILDLDRYTRRIREPFAAKQAAGSVALADLRGPEQVLVISDWSGGEGAVQHDAEDPGRWRSGSGVDGYSRPGSVRVGPHYSAVVSSAQNEWGQPMVYGAKVYVPTSLGPALFSYDGATVAAAFSPAAGRMPSCWAVYLNRLYFGNSGDGTVATFDGTTWTAVAFTLAAGRASAMATHYRQAAQYLYVAAAGGGLNGTCRVVFWDTSALSPGQFDMEEPGCKVMIPWRHQLWVFSQDTVRRVGGIYSVDDSTSGGVWETHARLEGNHFSAGCAFDDAIYLGCGLYGEIYRWDGTRLELAYRLGTRDAAYGFDIRGMAVWDGALWVTISDGAGGTGLLRYDPSSIRQAQDGAGHAAWSRPLKGVGGSGPNYAVPFLGDLFISTYQTGAATAGFVRSTLFAASGQLESGLVSCGLPGVSKLFRSVTIVTSALASGQSIQVEYRLEDTGGWTSLGTLSAVGATTATYPFAANTTGRQIAFRLTFAGPAGSAAAATLYELSLRYVPRPAVTREWELAVVLEGTDELPLVTLDGESSPLTGAQLTAALWTAAGSAGPVTLVDLDGSSYSVYVQDVREEIGKISQRRGWNRLGLVKLVEAA